MIRRPLFGACRFAILAAIELPGIGRRFYVWHDDLWVIGANNVWGAMLVTLPPEKSHEMFLPRCYAWVETSAPLRRPVAPPT